VSFVSRELHLIIFNDVLFNDCVSFVHTLSMGNSSRIYICPGDESIVSWDVTSSLCCSNSKIMEFIFLFGMGCVEFFSGILAIGAVGDVVFGLEETSL